MERGAFFRTRRHAPAGLKALYNQKSVTGVATLMAADNPASILNHLRRAFALPVAPGVPDAELLERFFRHRDEAAFELLVWRHERMVWGLCCRVLRNRCD